MIVTASAGNSGNETDDQRFVSCPADGDSVYAVGAVDYLGHIAGFAAVRHDGRAGLKSGRTILRHRDRERILETFVVNRRNLSGRRALDRARRLRFEVRLTPPQTSRQHHLINLQLED